MTRHRLIGPRRCKHLKRHVEHVTGFESRCTICGSVNAFVSRQRGRSLTCRRVWMRPDDPRLGADAGRVAEALIANAREEVR